MGLFEAVAWVLVGMSLLGGIGVALRWRRFTLTHPHANPDPQDLPSGADTGAENAAVAEHSLGAGARPAAGEDAGTMTHEEAVWATLADLASRPD